MLVLLQSQFLSPLAEINLMTKLFFMHKQSLPEADECTQASHYNITGLGVVNFMGKCSQVCTIMNWDGPGKWPKECMVRAVSTCAIMQEGPQLKTPPNDCITRAASTRAAIQ